MNAYRINIQPLSEEDGGGYLVRVPELPGCMADGETMEEAIQDATGAIAEWIAAAEAMGRVVPAPGSFDSFSGKWLQRVPKQLHMELVSAAESEGVSLNQLVVSLVSKGLGERRSA